jgi:hypothetical protein
MFFFVVGLKAVPGARVFFLYGNPGRNKLHLILKHIHKELFSPPQMEKSSIRKALIILFGHLWVTELTYR